jgi:hypothetical protein
MRFEKCPFHMALNHSKSLILIGYKSLKKGSFLLFGNPKALRAFKLSREYSWRTVMKKLALVWMMVLITISVAGAENLKHARIKIQPTMLGSGKVAFELKTLQNEPSLIFSDLTISYKISCQTACLLNFQLNPDNKGIIPLEKRWKKLNSKSYILTLSGSSYQTLSTLASSSLLIGHLNVFKGSIRSIVVPGKNEVGRSRAPSSNIQGVDHIIQLFPYVAPPKDVISKSKKKKSLRKYRV